MKESKENVYIFRYTLETNSFCLSPLLCGPFKQLLDRVLVLILIDLVFFTVFPKVFHGPLLKHSETDWFLYKVMP